MHSDCREADDATLARRVGASPRSPAATAAEAEIYRRFAPRVRLYGLRHLRDAQAAADLAQQVLLMTIERLRAGEVREPGRIGSFVLGMCRIVVVDLKRARNRQARLLRSYADDAPGGSPDCGPRLDDGRLLRCLERLPERDRSVLVMTFYDERGSGEVAAALGLAEGNVRVIRHRALERLRRCVQGDGAAQ